MIIKCKVLIEPNVIVERVIRDVDYVSIGKKSLSYRLTGKNQFIYSLRFDSTLNIRIEDSTNETN